MDAQPRWYPVAAAVTLLLTGFAVFTTSRVQKFVEDRDYSSQTTLFPRRKQAISDRPTGFKYIEMRRPLSYQTLDILPRRPPLPGKLRSSYREEKKLQSPIVHQTDTISPILPFPPRPPPSSHVRPRRRTSSPPLKGYGQSRIDNLEVSMFADPGLYFKNQMDAKRGRLRETIPRPSARRNSPAGFWLGARFPRPCRLIESQPCNNCQCVAPEYI
jgi:hypothetical protein